MAVVGILRVPYLIVLVLRFVKLSTGQEANQSTLAPFPLPPSAPPSLSPSNIASIGPAPQSYSPPSPSPASSPTAPPTNPPPLPVNLVVFEMQIAGVPTAYGDEARNGIKATVADVAGPTLSIAHVYLCVGSTFDIYRVCVEPTFEANRTLIVAIAFELFDVDPQPAIDNVTAAFSDAGAATATLSAATDPPVAVLSVVRLPQILTTDGHALPPPPPKTADYKDIWRFGVLLGSAAAAVPFFGVLFVCLRPLKKGQ